MVRVLEEVIRHYQIDPRPLLESYGINDELLARPKGRISIPKFMRLGHQAIEITGDPALGLLMGERTHIGHAGMPGFAAMTAPTLGRALATLIHFERLGSQNQRGYSRIYREGHLGVTQFYSISPYNEYNFFVVDLMLSSWLYMAQWLTGQTRLVREVHIEYPCPSYHHRFKEVFQCPVLFEQQRNALFWSQEALQLPSLYASPAAHAEAIAACNSELSAMLVTQGMKERVVTLLGPLLQGRTPSLQEVAAQLGMPPWTLRRRLEREGVRFQDLLEQTRHSLAESYVRNTELNFTEIAFRLGFSSPAAFHRAFRRWTGHSPGDYRQSQGKQR